MWPSSPPTSTTPSRRLLQTPLPPSNSRSPSSSTKTNKALSRRERTDYAATSTSPREVDIFSEIDHELQDAHEDLLGSLHDDEGEKTLGPRDRKVFESRSSASNTLLRKRAEMGDNSEAVQKQPSRIMLSPSVTSGLAWLGKDSSEDEREQQRKERMLDLRGGGEPERDQYGGYASPDWVSEATIESYDRAGVEEELEEDDNNNNNNNNKARHSVNTIDLIAGFPSNSASDAQFDEWLDNHTKDLGRPEPVDDDMFSNFSSKGRYQKKSTNLSRGAMTTKKAPAYSLFPRMPTASKYQNKFSSFEFDLSDQEDGCSTPFPQQPSVDRPTMPLTPTPPNGGRHVVPPPKSAGADRNGISRILRAGKVSKALMPLLEPPQKARLPPPNPTIRSGDPLPERKRLARKPTNEFDDLESEIDEYHSYAKDLAAEENRFKFVSPVTDSNLMATGIDNSPRPYPPPIIPGSRKCGGVPKMPTKALDSGSRLRVPGQQPYASSSIVRRGVNPSGTGSYTREHIELAAAQRREWDTYSGVQNSGRNNRARRYIQGLPDPSQMADPDSAATIRDDASFAGSAHFNSDIGTDVLAISVVSQQQKYRNALNRLSTDLSVMPEPRPLDAIDKKANMEFVNAAKASYKIYIQKLQDIDNSRLPEQEKELRRQQTDAGYANRFRTIAFNKGYSLFRARNVWDTEAIPDEVIIAKFKEIYDMPTEEELRARRLQAARRLSQRASRLLAAAAPGSSDRTAVIEKIGRIFNRGMRWILAAPTDVALKSWSRRSPPEQVVQVETEAGPSKPSPPAVSKPEISIYDQASRDAALRALEGRSDDPQQDNTGSIFSKRSGKRFPFGQNSSNVNKGKGKERAVAPDENGPGAGRDRGMDIEMSGFSGISGSTLRGSREASRSGRQQAPTGDSLTGVPYESGGYMTMTAAGEEFDKASQVSEWPTLSQVYQN